MSSTFLVVYTSAHLIGAVSYPLPEKICEQVRDLSSAVYEDHTFVCERQATRPKVQANIDTEHRARFESDCWTLYGGMKNCRQLPNGDVEMHTPWMPSGRRIFSTIKFKDRLKDRP
ncbi:hypothetical protein [Bradyrhizobium ottawaense]|uniref:hypothetical protein n=1 Tax=Bradyrhizobium ottawaense TaxID=931866 RepID=UPI001BAB7FBF|nr:hypothetical protein [Bradyrhizobium ottawaense]MBR1332821.1 hypothetical protein [Bradyrhizobium ottawaense]